MRASLTVSISHLSDDMIFKLSVPSLFHYWNTTLSRCVHNWGAALQFKVILFIWRKGLINMPYNLMYIKHWV